jgi:hypothetical protein
MRGGVGEAHTPTQTVLFLAFWLFNSIMVEQGACL